MKKKYYLSNKQGKDRPIKIKKNINETDQDSKVFPKVKNLTNEIKNEWKFTNLDNSKKKFNATEKTDNISFKPKLVNVIDFESNWIDNYDYYIKNNNNLKACVTIISFSLLPEQYKERLLSHLSKFYQNKIVCFAASSAKIRHDDIFYLISYSQMIIYVVNQITFEDQYLISEIDNRITKQKFALIENTTTKDAMLPSDKIIRLTFKEIDQINLKECPPYMTGFSKIDYEKYSKMKVKQKEESNEYTMVVPKYHLTVDKDDKKNVMIVTVKLLIFGNITRNDIKPQLSIENLYLALLKISAFNENHSMKLHHYLSLSLNLSLFDGYDFNSINPNIEIDDTFVICIFEMKPFQGNKEIEKKK